MDYTPLIELLENSSKEKVNENAVYKELEWLQFSIYERIIQMDINRKSLPIKEVTKIPDHNPESNYGQFILEHQIDVPERLAIALAMARSLHPDSFRRFTENFSNFTIQSQFGGTFDKELQRFLPTLETLLFLLAGNSLILKQTYLLRFNKKHPLFVNNVLFTESPATNDNSRFGTDHINEHLRISPAFLRYFMGGEAPRLDEDSGFPAQLSTTSKKFEDVILPPQVREQLEDVVKYVKHKPTAIEITGDKEKWKSYVVVFSGFPGTGKTITATTIGKMWNIPVYIVNQAQLVSKYVGETQKHLEKLFDRFDSHECILFFDEADAIFGKRVDVKSSNDHHVNQDVTYLLQRISQFNGLIILATNVHDVEGAFDKAFQRRFKRHIHFCFPDYAERHLLWQKALPQPYQYQEGLLEDLTKFYQINGSSIDNIISDVIIEAIDQNTNVISSELIERFLKLDYKRRKMAFERHTDEEVFEKPVLRYGQGMPASTREFEGIEEKLKSIKQQKTNL